MADLIFNEESMLNGNIFKFEQRLQSHVNKYIENGALLTTYYSQNENNTTVDRGIQDIDQLFGKQSPLRYNKIIDFPVYGFGKITPDNEDSLQIEDFNVEGDCTILPSTIVPKPLDFFTINHLKMNAIFEVTNVQYDSMKVEGYYKIHYRLHSTSNENLQYLMNQTVATYHTDLNAVGTTLNPIIKEDDFVLRNRIIQMTNQMIQSYKALFYNERHNCFLYYDHQTGNRIFDTCGHLFMTKHGLMNAEGSPNVIVLSDKLNDSQRELYYNNSIYTWIELGCPKDLIQKFHYILISSSGYLYSSFVRWCEDDINIIIPLSVYTAGENTREYSYFDEKQFESLLDNTHEPLTGSEYEKLLWKFIHRTDSLSIHDISITSANVLLNSIKNNIDTFLYTPIMIYIIRYILELN
jgi:hypothetical protein